MIIPSGYLKLAAQNMARYGDTDIFPFPIETYMFHDCEKAVLDVLNIMDEQFYDYIDKYPVTCVKSLSVVGYNGFRSATQIDPIWNAYFLGLVLTLGNDIENARVPADRNIVFSYRFKPDCEKGMIFNREYGWTEFQQAAVEVTKDQTFVLSCDISNFYPRIYHHRLENSLKRVSTNTECIRRVMMILSAVSGGVSYGLPVGGPAARLLSECVLNAIDRLLIAHDIRFCRFVDDFYVFANSREEAYLYLVKLSQMLLENEGMSIQRSKTRIFTRDEFLLTSQFAQENKPESEHEKERRSFMGLRLYYDPYSPSSDEDYELLKQELEKFDVVGMLTREVRKGRIEEQITRQLVRAIKYLGPSVKSEAIISLIFNLQVLYPVFPAVMIVIKSVIDELDTEVLQIVFNTLRKLIREGSYLTQVPTNLAFAIRVLAYDPSEETDVVLNNLYNAGWDMMIKRDIILIMAKRNAGYWISNCRHKYYTLTPWEKRALVISSYILEDEGYHWRESIKNELMPPDELAKTWASEKKSKGKWDLPL